MDAAVPAIASSASAMERREIKDMIRDLSVDSLKSGRKRNREDKERGKTASPEKSCGIPLSLWNNAEFPFRLRHCGVLSL